MMEIVLQSRRVTPQGVAAEYGIPVTTQRDLRVRGEFVAAIKVGGRLYYRREQLEAWLDTRALGGDDAAMIDKEEAAPGEEAAPENCDQQHHQDTESGHASSSEPTAALENVAVWYERLGDNFDDVLVSVKYDKRAVSAIRMLLEALPEWAGWWDADSKVWRIHPGYAERLAASLRRLGYTVGGGW
jgi:Helix-turn-helix domain